MMPKISGFDMLDILRSTTETHNVKVIMMTALSSEDQRKRGESLGADRYLVKSQVGIEDVVSTVHEVMGDGTSTASAPTMVQQSQAITEPTQPQPTVQPIVQSPVQQPVAPQPVATSTPVSPTLTSLPSNPPTLQPVLRPTPTPMSNPRPDITPLSRPTASQPVNDVPAADNGVRPIQPIPVVQAPVADSTPVSQPEIPSFTPNMPPVPAPIAEPTIDVQSGIGVNPAPISLQPTSPVATFAPQPVQLPQPTAPFSTPRPRNLGDRIIQPIEQAPQPSGASLSEQMNATLGDIQPITPQPITNVPPTAPVTPLPEEPSQQQATTDPAPTLPTPNLDQSSGLNFEEIPRNDQQPPAAI